MPLWYTNKTIYRYLPPLRSLPLPQPPPQKKIYIYTPIYMIVRGFMNMVTEWLRMPTPKHLSFYSKCSLNTQNLYKTLPDRTNVHCAIFKICFSNKEALFIYTVRPRKNRTLKQWNATSMLWGVWLLSYIFYQLWLICFRMIHSWNSSGNASLSSIVFKIECQNPFVTLLATCT